MTETLKIIIVSEDSLAIPTDLVRTRNNDALLVWLALEGMRKAKKGDTITMPDLQKTFPEIVGINRNRIRHALGFLQHMGYITRQEIKGYKTRLTIVMKPVQRRIYDGDTIGEQEAIRFIESAVSEKKESGECPIIYKPSTEHNRQNKQTETRPPFPDWFLPYIKTFSTHANGSLHPIASWSEDMFLFFSHYSSFDDIFHAVAEISRFTGEAKDTKRLYQRRFNTVGGLRDNRPFELPEREVLEMRDKLKCSLTKREVKKRPHDFYPSEEGGISPVDIFDVMNTLDRGLAVERGRIPVYMLKKLPTAFVTDPEKGPPWTMLAPNNYIFFDKDTSYGWIVFDNKRFQSTQFAKEVRSLSSSL